MILGVPCSNLMDPLAAPKLMRETKIITANFSILSKMVVLHSLFLLTHICPYAY